MARFVPIDHSKVISKISLAVYTDPVLGGAGITFNQTVNQSMAYTPIQDNVNKATIILHVVKDLDPAFVCEGFIIDDVRRYYRTFGQFVEWYITEQIGHGPMVHIPHRDYLPVAISRLNSGGKPIVDYGGYIIHGNYGLAITNDVVAYPPYSDATYKLHLNTYTTDADTLTSKYISNNIPLLVKHYRYVAVSAYKCNEYAIYIPGVKICRTTTEWVAEMKKQWTDICRTPVLFLCDDINMLPYNYMPAVIVSLHVSDQWMSASWSARNTIRDAPQTFAVINIHIRSPISGNGPLSHPGYVPPYAVSDITPPAKRIKINENPTALMAGVTAIPLGNPTPIPWGMPQAAPPPGNATIAISGLINNPRVDPQRTPGARQMHADVVVHTEGQDTCETAQRGPDLCTRMVY